MERTINQKGKQNKQDKQQKRRELAVFIFLAGILFPILAVLVVSGYGFLVWMVQWFTGPPGPPG